MTTLICTISGLDDIPLDRRHVREEKDHEMRSLLGVNVQLVLAY